MDKHKYAAYCRQAVEEGCVLLENDGTLPFLKNERIAIFGREQFEYVKSGSGSGGGNRGRIHRRTRNRFLLTVTAPGIQRKLHRTGIRRKGNDFAQQRQYASSTAAGDGFSGNSMRIHFCSGSEEVPFRHRLRIPHSPVPQQRKRPGGSGTPRRRLAKNAYAYDRPGTFRR